MVYGNYSYVLFSQFFGKFEIISKYKVNKKTTRLRPRSPGFRFRFPFTIWVTFVISPNLSELWKIQKSSALTVAWHSIIRTNSSSSIPLHWVVLTFSLLQAVCVTGSSYIHVSRCSCANLSLSGSTCINGDKLRNIRWSEKKNHSAKGHINMIPFM